MMNSDFAFSVLSEEWGWVGVSILFALYLFIVGRSLWIAANARDGYSRLLAGARAMTFSVYVLVNGSMVVGFLPVDDPGLSVGEQRRRERPHGRALVADVVEVGELVEDQHVRDPVVAGQPPMGVHTSQERRVRHEPPRFVVHDPALTAVGVEQGGFHPCRRARH